MEREILFRGFCPSKNGDETIILDEEEIMGDWRYWNCFDGINRLNAGFMVTDTVGQYTGLTDKNGKKIFEGDIVVCRYANEYTPVFQNGIYMAYNPKEMQTIQQPSTQFNIIWRNGCEVIGTIFDKEAGDD